MQLTIGDISIELINESTIMADAGGPFGLVPSALWSGTYDHDERFRVAMHHINLLVQNNDRIIIVDTGNGHDLRDGMVEFLDMKYPEGGLLEALKARNIAPEDVDMVINTHLHADHCGTNTLPTEESYIAAFPNAEYIVQEREYQDALFPNERTQATYYPKNYKPLVDKGQMRLIKGDQEIVPGIRGVVTPGHTPGHQSILFESNGEVALFCADMATFAVHFAKLAWMTAYDIEPMITLETKRVWQRWALEHDATLIFQHDPQTYAGKLYKDKKGQLRIQPLIEAE